MDLLLISKNENFKSYKNEKMLVLEENERKIKNEISKYNYLKIKYDELKNKDNSFELLFKNYKNKEKENEQIIISLNNELSRKTKEKDIIEKDNLDLKCQVERLEKEVKDLTEKITLTFTKLKEESEIEKAYLFNFLLNYL
jgi:hypothetical protein